MRKRAAKLLLFFIFARPLLLLADESVKFKILAVNPSETMPLKATVSQYLPPEIKPEDIVDRADLDVKYDTEKKALLLSKEIELQPKEARTLIVKVKNVWKVDAEEMDKVKAQLQDSMTALAGTKFAETGKLLHEKSMETLARIEEAQAKSMGIKQQIDLYRLSRTQLEEIKQNTFSLESLRQMEVEKSGGVRQVKFWITAENPAPDEKKMSVRALLPKELKSTDILDKLDFNLAFDSSKSRFALEKEDTFAGKEIKKYQIILRDIWFIPQQEIDFLKDETQKLVDLFMKSSFEAFAVKQQETINETLQAIMELQSGVESSTVLEDRMRAFVLNSQRMDLVKKKIRALQDLLPEIPVKSGAVQDIAEAIQHFVKKVAETKKLILMAMGIQPNKPITWWIIIGIIIFLAGLTTIFYFVWLKKLSDNKFVKGSNAKKGAKAPKDSSPETPPNNPEDQPKAAV